MQASDQAWDYIRSMTDARQRRVATDYAQMDTSEFQARFGPGFDDLDEKVDEILEILRDSDAASIAALTTTHGPLTAMASWVEATTLRQLVTALATLIIAGAALIERFMQ